MSNYYRIYFGEGYVSVENLSKEDILDNLNDEEEEEDGFSEKMSIDLKEGKSVEWPENCECYKSIIIKGEIIFPKKVQVVTKFTIE